jgi:hypothetical protein
MSDHPTSSDISSADAQPEPAPQPEPMVPVSIAMAVPPNVALIIEVNGEIVVAPK